MTEDPRVDPRADPGADPTIYAERTLRTLFFERKCFMRAMSPLSLLLQLTTGNTKGFIEKGRLFLERGGPGGPHAEKRGSVGGSGGGSTEAGEGVSADPEAPESPDPGVTKALCVGVWAESSGYDSLTGVWTVMRETCLHCGAHRPPGSKSRCNGEGRLES